MDCWCFVCRLSDLVTLVDNGLQLEVYGSECQRLAFGEQLKSSISNFTIDFIPHMDEEEEVGSECMVGSRDKVQARGQSADL